AWTTNERLQRYYLEHGFTHVRTEREGGAVNGGPRVSGWLAQRATGSAEHGFTDETLRAVA
ncbi:GNAT family N-acetyltransferase, partial [Streptomyces sp. NPDC057757]